MPWESGNEYPPEDSWGDSRKLGAPVDLGAYEFDPRRIGQGYVGDCWLIAALMSICATPWGAEYLANGLAWDAYKGGYWVTLYRDGKPIKVFVDSVHKSFGEADGVNPSWLSVYEEAIYQERQKEGDLERGVGGDAYNRLLPPKGDSGNPGRTNILFGASANNVSDEVGKGNIVTAGTNPSPLFSDKHARNTPLRDPGTGELKPGETVRISLGHEYTVKQVAANGDVLVLNPWGPGNAYDDGNVIRLSPNEFNGLFNSISWASGDKPSR
jgi:hypothetical protein